MDLILADDSIIIREGLSRILTDTGHHISCTVTRAEPLLADDQRADRVVGREPAGVPDDVGVAGPQAERFLDVQPGTAIIINTQSPNEKIAIGPVKP